MLLYFISLFYLTQLVLSQIPSESEEINKIIGNILLKAEKKNADAERRDFPWNNGFAVTKRSNKHKTRNSKIDFNPFLRTQYPRSKPTLRLQDLLPSLNKPSNIGLKDEYKTSGDGAQDKKVHKEHQNHSKEKLNKNKQITPSMNKMTHFKENYGTSAVAANLGIKMHRKTKAPVIHQALSMMIPEEPHEKMFSESIFTTPQTTDPPEDITFMHQEPTTKSNEFLFDTMESTSSIDRMSAVKIFRYGDKSSTTTDITHFGTYTPGATITPTDWLSLKDAEDLVKSVPKYDKTSDSSDDSRNGITDDSTNLFGLSSSETLYKNSDIGIQSSYGTDNILDSSSSSTPDRRLKEFRTEQTLLEDQYTEVFRISTPTRYTAKSDSSDLYLLVEPKDKSLKAVFTLENNVDTTTEDPAELLKKIESYMDKTKSPTTSPDKGNPNEFGVDVEEIHISDIHTPCSLNPNLATETVRTTETNKKVLNYKKTGTAKIESELAKKKGEKMYKESSSIVDKTANVSSKKSDSHSQESGAVSTKDFTADKKANVDIKESKIDDKERYVTGKETEVIGKESDIVAKESSTVNNKASDISDKETNIQGKSDKLSKKIDTITSNSDIADKKSNIADKKGNTANKKTNLADLYDDILKIYGSLKESTDRVPQKFHEKITKHLNWESVKKFFGHDRVCNCKCKANKTLCKVCAASDAVMRELTFEFNNLADYMNAHCTEIQTFFWMNPSGGKKLRDTVHRIDRTMQDYYKRVRGKCTGKKCNTFATYLDKKRYVDKKKRDRKYLIELLRDLEISDV